MRKIIPVILAGGTGSRLWPLSRESFPKQFLQLTEQDNYTLLQKTYKRIEDIENICDPIIICNDEHRFIVKDQLDHIEVQAKSIILEPCQRNTAPAIAIAALFALENNEDPHLLVLAADHEIKNSNIGLACKDLSKSKLSIFGSYISIFTFLFERILIKSNTFEFLKSEQFSLNVSPRINALEFKSWIFLFLQICDISFTALYGTFSLIFLPAKMILGL